MTKYSLIFTSEFQRRYRKSIKANMFLKKRIDRVIIMLAKYPKDKSLNTHKVKLGRYGECYSSRISGDIRLLWRFTDEKVQILVLTIGGHDGKLGVYK